MTTHQQSEPNAQPASEARVVSKPGAAIKVTQIPIPPDVQREIARGLELGTKAAETLGGPPRLAASDDPPWESLSRQAELRRESLVEKFKKIYEAGGKAWEGVITGRDANGVCQVCGAEGRELHREECPVVSRRYADLELTNHDSNSGTLDGTGHLLIAPPASEASGREESLNSLEARLAADIRAIDGNHDKGAAELAEQLIARGWHPAPAGEREEVERLRERIAVMDKRYADMTELSIDQSRFLFALAKGNPIPERGMDLHARRLALEASERAAALEASHAALQVKLDAVAGLLRRISGWDHMDTAADGAYWLAEIAAALAE
jgi:hypothetical protein